ncbi:MAG: hypothetical protein LBS34_02270, partial [Rickettsiales bacterium]|nr:hypothetical protein [Rickettsiales bacterium]
MVFVGQPVVSNTYPPTLYSIDFNKKIFTLQTSMGGFMEIKALVFDIDGVLLDHEDEEGHRWLEVVENDLMLPRELIEKIHKDVQRWRLLTLGTDKIEEYFSDFILENNITRINSMQLL